MNDLLCDIGLAVRATVRRPGHSMIVILTLALGVGCVTTVFVIIDAVVLRPLDLPDPSRLIMVYETVPEEGNFANLVSPNTFREWQRRTRSFASLAAYHTLELNRSDLYEPVRVRAGAVSTGFFASVLAVPPLYGRLFGREEAAGGTAAETMSHSVILGHGYWQRAFGNDPEVIGSTLVLDDDAYEIIGVLGPEARLPGELSDVELWLPLVLPPATESGLNYLSVMGRLAGGVGLDPAQEEMSRIATQLAAEGLLPQGRGAKVTQLETLVAGELRAPLILNLGATLLVLMIAGVNVATISLARATERRQELTLRTVLGASRWHLLRQTITESLVLGVIGGAAGCLAAFWLIELVSRTEPGALGRFRGLEIGPVSIIVAFILTALLIIACVAAPTAISIRGSQQSGLDPAIGRTTGLSLAHRRALSLLVVGQVSLALLLLIGAGLLVRSMLRLQSVDPGFDPKGLVAMELELPSLAEQPPAERSLVLDQILEQVRSLPEIGEAVLVSPLPMSGQMVCLGFEIEGRPEPDSSHGRSAHWRSVSPEYFRTLGIPLIEGRGFTVNDSAESEPVILINQTMARRFFGRSSPLGRQLLLRYRQLSCRIIGVVGDVHHAGLGAETEAEMYMSMLQAPLTWTHLVVRSEMQAAPLAAAIGLRVRTLAPGVPLGQPISLDALVADSVSNPRFSSLVLDLFALVSCLLAAVGTSGTLAFVLERRRREIGLRLALGARPAAVLGLVLGQSLRLVVLAIAVGLPCACCLAYLLRGYLFEVGPVDPATYVLATLMILAATLAAALLPAWRAAKVDPAITFREA